MNTEEKKNEELLNELMNSGKSNKEIFKELIKQGKDVVLMDHNPTIEEINEKGFDLNKEELIKAIKENYEKGTNE